MRMLQGTNITAGYAAANAPQGYILSQPSYGLRPGYVRAGPDLDTITTVCLHEGDDGAWFRKLVAQRNGVVIEVS
jgi:hypothetical protein